MPVVHAVVAFVGVLAMDWALYERLLLCGEVIWSVEPGYRYRDTLYPRAIVTAISAVLIAIASTTNPVNLWTFFVGVGGSVLSVVYAIIVTSIRKHPFGS